MRIWDRVVVLFLALLIIVGYASSLKAAEPEHECLAQAVYYEARSESIDGQMAVATVIMNRVSSSRFPDTVCQVVQQGGTRKYHCQFSYWCDGLPEVPMERAAWITSQRIATLALYDGLRIGTVQNATHYHATYARTRRWMKELVPVAQIDNHIFLEDR